MENEARGDLRIKYPTMTHQPSNSNPNESEGPIYIISPFDVAIWLWICMYSILF